MLAYVEPKGAAALAACVTRMALTTPQNIQAAIVEGAFRPLLLLDRQILHEPVQIFV